MGKLFTHGSGMHSESLFMNRLFMRGLLLALLVPALVRAQVSTQSGTLDETIASAEYFVDVDPGVGAGVPLGAVDGSFDSSSEEIEFQVESAGLASGSHVVYVRLQDENGLWGRPRSAAIKVVVKDEEIPPAVVAAEYFVDVDPGEGEGTAITGDFSGDTVSLEYEVSTEGLSSGSHVVYTRFQDEDGAWGRPKSAKLQVTLENEMAFPAIAAAEYFVDEDPGAGQGTAIAGDFGGDTVSLEYEVSTEGLSSGSHVVYTRLQDEDGVWGHPKSAKLQVTLEDEMEFPAIAAAEYFVDADPGEGQGTAIAGDFGGDTVSLEYEVSTERLSSGSHVVYTRLLDEDGIWGCPKSAVIQVIGEEEGVAPAIVAAEYFIDADPGEGSATPLTPEDGSFDSDMEVGELGISVEGLSVGRHVAYVRFQDEDGAWGYPVGKLFSVRKPVDDTQAEYQIAAGEYFVDKDPGEGNGVPLQSADGSWGGGFEEAIGQIETADLSVGQHTVSVRMQDQEGLWGRTRTIPFTVEPPPPEKPEMVVDDAGPHDFGGLKIDTRSEWTFTVSNASGAEDTLKVRKVEVAEPYAVSIASFELAPGRSQRVTVTFFPTEEGIFAQNLVIRSNDVENPRLEIGLMGQAVPEQPEMALSTATNDHDFGAVRIGGAGEWALVVANNGVDSLRVLSVATEAPFGAAPTEFDVPPGDEQAVLVTYEPAEEGAQSGHLHLRTNDPNQREVEIALSGEGVEFGVPVAEVGTPAEEQAGAVGIDFQITDDDDSDVDIGFAYEVGGTRRTATVSGVDAQLTAAQYKGITLTVTWDTETDLAGQDESVRFVITVSDADHPTGKQAITADFQVDNNQIPIAVLTAPAGPVGRVVEIPFALSDAENDLLTLAGEYSTDGGSSWVAATILSEIADINQYESSVLWDAFADLGYGSFPVRFRLTPGDSDSGTPGEAELQVVHRVADYDGDQDIDFDDLTLFLVAWNQLPKDIAADIGPTTGRVPDLVPAGDEALDFEDVVVLIQMWNWSAGVHPPAKLAEGRVGPEALALESVQVGDQVALDVRLLAGAPLAVGLELSYDADAWELVEVEAGEVFADPTDLLLLKRETEPGQLAVQLGSLGGPATAAGSLLRLYFAPRGRGGEQVRLRYDLRDGNGQRYAAGSLAQRVRPVPEQFFLSANMPNPFNPGTQIPYGLAEEAFVELTIYDILGRQVVQPVGSSLQPSGYYRVSWDGRDATGRLVGSGVYLYRLVARPAAGGEPRAEIRRMLLLR